MAKKAGKTVINALIEIEDEVEKRGIRLIRRVSGSNPDMASLFRSVIESKHASARRESVQRLVVRFGNPETGTQPEWFPDDIGLSRSERKLTRVFRLTLRYGHEPHLTVLEPAGSISFDGPLIGFVAAYDTLSHEKLAAHALAREAANRRQRARRAQRKLEAQVEKNHQRDPKIASKIRSKYEPVPDFVPPGGVPTKRK